MERLEELVSGGFRHISNETWQNFPDRGVIPCERLRPWFAAMLFTKDVVLMPDGTTDGGCKEAKGIPQTDTLGRSSAMQRGSWHFIPRANGGSPPHLRDRANGDFQMARGSKSDGYANFLAILGHFGKTAKRSHFGPPRPPKSDSRPRFCTERTENQLIWSILEPFGEDFLPNQAKSEPSNPGGNLAFDFVLFFSMDDPVISRSQKGLGNIIFGELCS